MGVATYPRVSGVLTEENRNGTVTTYVSDALGSVIKAVDQVGTVTSEATYWPYGEARTQTGTNPSLFGFCGSWGYYSNTVARVYVRARSYRADLTRWTTVDPLSERHRMGRRKRILTTQKIQQFGIVRKARFEGSYSYSAFSPVTFFDKSGEFPQDQTWGPYANFGRCILGYPNYGNYCGAHTKCESSFPPEPRDCLDAACQAHDICIETTERQGEGFFWFDDDPLACHCNLAAAALKCTSLFGCKPWKIGCYSAATQTLLLFEAGRGLFVLKELPW